MQRPFVTSQRCWGLVSGAPVAWRGDIAPPNGALEEGRQVNNKKTQRP